MLLLPQNRMYIKMYIQQFLTGSYYIGPHNKFLTIAGIKSSNGFLGCFSSFLLTLEALTYLDFLHTHQFTCTSETDGCCVAHRKAEVTLDYSLCHGLLYAGWQPVTYTLPVMSYIPIQIGREEKYIISCICCYLSVLPHPRYLWIFCPHKDQRTVMRFRKGRITPSQDKSLCLPDSKYSSPIPPKKLEKSVVLYYCFAVYF